MKKVKVSIPSNGSIQFLQTQLALERATENMSQSPQTGQFNSYRVILYLLRNVDLVSIPSNGSIQFLRKSPVVRGWMVYVSIPSNGSIQFLRCNNNMKHNLYESQSPQTGQFNSYLI